MPIETFNYIDSLNSSNPGSSDDVLQGDDHIRGIKSALKNSFPNLAAAATATAAQFNQLVSGVYTFAAGSIGAPSAYFVDTTLGFYKSAAGLIGIAGRLIGNGSTPVGSVQMFLAPPENAGTDWLLLDGSTYNNTAFPRLATHLAQVGSTFTLPDLVTVGRFPRSVWTGNLGAGETLANAIKSHTAPVTGTADDHTHSFSGSDNASLSGQTSILTLTATGAPVGALNVGASVQAGSISLNDGSFSGTTGGASAHGISGTATYTGGNETRPECIAFWFYVKT
jgi:hypothetical protein